MSEDAKKKCELCDYPLFSGHASTCKKRKDESDEAREGGYQVFKVFLEKHGIDKMGVKDKIAWLKKADFETIMKILGRLNGRLAQQNKRQEWDGKAIKSVVRKGYGGSESTDLEPPENAEEDLKKVFDNLKKEINEDSVSEWAVRIYFAIVFAHAFENGNGRTARNVYYLLMNEGIPPKEVSMERGSVVIDTCVRASLDGMRRLFRKYGVPNCEELKDVQEHYLTTDGISIGDMDYLKYLAAREALIATGTHVSLLPNVIEYNNLGEERKILYNQIYERLRKEWFEEIQNSAVQYNKYFVKLLNGALTKV